MVEFGLLLIMSIGLSGVFLTSSTKTLQDAVPKTAMKMENYLQTGSGFTDNDRTGQITGANWSPP